MPKKSSSGRSGQRAPPPPPQERLPPTPSPQSDTDPDPDMFDPNRTPPPPADPIFLENTPEQKVFEIPPLRSVTKAKARPLTGRPAAPQWSRGVKRSKGSTSERKTGSGRKAATPPDPMANPLKIIQTSLHQIQSYLDTLAAVRTQRNEPQGHTQTHRTQIPPRATPGPSSSPTTLADLITMPQQSRKR